MSTSIQGWEGGLTPAQKIIADNMTEEQLLKNILKMAHLCGWLAYHTRSAINRRGVWSTPIQGDPGFPDLVLARNKKVIFAELKRETSGLSVVQYGWYDAIGNVYLWRPSDWLSGEIERILKEGRNVRETL